jgi:hypothetical protein
MDRSERRLRIPRAVVVVLALAAPLAIAAGTWADDEKPKAKDSQLAKDLVGTWAFAGTPDDENQPPAPGTRLKFFTGKHWTVTASDEAGKVVYHHGGTYTLDGDEYAETIKYATENASDLVGKTNKFKIKVEGDKYTQIGVGNPYNEVWKRAK